MKIELRRVSINARMSQETTCFAADIWIDGQKVGDVSNQGHGGSHMINPHAVADRLADYAKTLPPIDVSDIYNDGQKHMMDPCAETVIDDLLSDFDARKQLVRVMKTKVVWRDGDKVMSKGPYKNPVDLTAAIVRCAATGRKVLNAMPLDEAVKLFRENS